MCKVSKKESVGEFEIKPVPGKFLKPKSWAREEGLDPHLFLYWDNEQIDYTRFCELKSLVCNKKRLRGA